MTAQIPEKLILDGEPATMIGFPELPSHDPRIMVLDPGKTQGSGIIFSTACWRRYQGTWEIRDGRLYLVDLQGLYQLETDQAPLFADWFTGELVIPRGKVIRYVHMGFESRFEQELHIPVKAGIVVDRRTIDNTHTDQPQSSG